MSFLFLTPSSQGNIRLCVGPHDFIACDLQRRDGGVGWWSPSAATKVRNLQLSRGERQHNAGTRALRGRPERGPPWRSAIVRFHGGPSKLPERDFSRLDSGITLASLRTWRYPWRFLLRYKKKPSRT